MKKKTLLTLALSLALVFGAFQAAFAGFGITGTAPDGNELAIETAAIKMMDEICKASEKNVDYTDRREKLFQTKVLHTITNTTSACRALRFYRRIFLCNYLDL